MTSFAPRGSGTAAREGVAGPTLRGNNDICWGITMIFVKGREGRGEGRGDDDHPWEEGRVRRRLLSFARIIMIFRATLRPQ